MCKLQSHNVFHFFLYYRLVYTYGKAVDQTHMDGSPNRVFIIEKSERHCATEVCTNNWQDYSTHIFQQINHQISLSQMPHWSHASLEPVNHCHMEMLTTYPLRINSKAPTQVYMLVWSSSMFLFPENVPKWFYWIRPLWHSLPCFAYPLFIYLLET